MWCTPNLYGNIKYQFCSKHIIQLLQLRPCFVCSGGCIFVTAVLPVELNNQKFSMHAMHFTIGLSIGNNTKTNNRVWNIYNIYILYCKMHLCIYYIRICDSPLYTYIDILRIKLCSYDSKKNFLTFIYTFKLEEFFAETNMYTRTVYSERK